jgi:hypothetical protein
VNRRQKAKLAARRRREQSRHKLYDPERPRPRHGPQPLTTQVALDRLLAEGRIRRVNPGALSALYETVRRPT